MIDKGKENTLKCMLFKAGSGKKKNASGFQIFIPCPEK